MNVVDAAIENLTSPIVLAFVAGVVAALARSSLRLPEQISKAISIYLLLAIGVKGGVSLSVADLGEVVGPAIATLALGVGTPVIAFGACSRIGRFNRIDSAALAAHYGSVSLVTFAAAITFVEALDLEPEGFMPALLTLLEIPAIVIALAIANRGAADGDRASIGATLRHVLPEPSVVLLVAGLVIGWIAGSDGYDQVAGFLDAPFRGILMLFMLQMGVLAGEHLRSLRRSAMSLVGLAIGLPLVNGTLGAVAGSLAGLSLGGTVVLATMAASASYIAAPAAVQLALPSANPAYYLLASIGITFPFNLAVGIPLYYEIATAVS